jgi:hypothetical protein
MGLTSLQVSHVDDDALEVVRARPRQLEVLPRVLTPSSVCVGQHLELQGERHFSIDLRGGAHVLLEPLDGSDVELPKWKEY